MKDNDDEENEPSGKEEKEDPHRGKNAVIYGPVRHILRSGQLKSKTIKGGVKPSFRVQGGRGKGRS